MTDTWVAWREKQDALPANLRHQIEKQQEEIEALRETIERLRDAIKDLTVLAEEILDE